VAYGVFFLDLAGLTVVLYSIAGLGSESWLLFYLIVFMATLGESVARSVGIGFGASALYVWLHVSQGREMLNDSDALLRFPLFLLTGALCGYLAQQVRRHKQRIRDLKWTAPELVTGA
jgi:hypothetical protein